MGPHLRYLVHGRCELLLSLQQGCTDTIKLTLDILLDHVSGVDAILAGHVQCINSCLESAGQGTGLQSDGFQTKTFAGRSAVKGAVMMLSV